MLGYCAPPPGNMKTTSGASPKTALGEDAAGIAGLQHLRGFLVAFGHQHAAVFKGAAALLQRPGDVGQVLFGVRAQVGGEAAGGLTQGGLAAGGEGDEVEGPIRRLGRGHRWGPPARRRRRWCRRRPSEFTPARRGPLRRGQSVRRSLTRKGLPSKSMAGFGASKFKDWAASVCDEARAWSLSGWRPRQQCPGDRCWS